MSFFALVYDRFPQFFTSIIKQNQSAMLITLCLIILGYMIVGKVKFAFEIVYVVMCLLWPFLHMFKAKPVIITNHL